MAEESVKVAVRVRPFNQREKDANAALVVQMTGNQTLISKPKSTEEPKKFAFDYSYWSHDGFKTETNGYASPENPNYCDQKKVYNDLGVGVLNNAWNGFNASLFAYGQTGSGKSYSVVGYGTNKGIVPMACEEIFKKIDADKSSGTQYEVTFSMLEIYSEVVRDLLNSKADRKSGLQVREDPKNGFFPQGLRRQLVSSYADITKLMDEGTSNRTIAATNMNATSSRAHTIVTINLVQKYKNPAGKEMAKSSIINLVDLAGSERADQTGATGDRLKEGAAINLSLTSLGNVISALADNSQGKNVKVPYRDSVLTKLLMNALGGNSKTIMIAAISPADINYDESLSTLRYADRAKQIKCKPVVNEDPTEKLIKSLQEENARLKKMLESGGKDPNAAAPAAPAAGGDAKGAASDAELKKQLEENEKQMNAMKQSYEEKLAEAKAELSGDNEVQKMVEKSRKFPHFSNINMDPSLSGKIRIILDTDGEKKVGVPGKSDIPLSGVGIGDPHALVTVKGGAVTLDRIGQTRVFRNGYALQSAAQLQHLDRVLFGTSQYFIFVDPSKRTEESVKNDVYFTFEMAQDEIAKNNGFAGDTKNMSKDEIKCQSELIDLIPAVEEANQMSIAIDKKVKFEAIAVAPEVRGEYDGKLKAFVIVRHFQSGLEWIWTKDKFLSRKDLMTHYYLDIKEDGKIDQERFKNFDPFSESPDTPTQIGTAVVFPKSFAYMVSNKGDYKISDLKGKPAGSINIEILPCDATGRVYTDKDGIVIKNPEKDLINKKVNFIIKINAAKLNPIYEDVFCQFTIFNDPNLNKTEIIRGTNNPDFKFSKQFTFEVTPEFLKNLLNKCFYIQVWGEQKHPKPDVFLSKISTKQYFDQEKDQNVAAKNMMNDKVFDAEKQRLHDDLKVLSAKSQNSALTIEAVRKLIDISKTKKHVNIPLPILEALLVANPEAVNQIIEKYSKAPDAPDEAPKAADQPNQPNQPQQAKTYSQWPPFMPPGFVDDFFDDFEEILPSSFMANRGKGKGKGGPAPGAAGPAGGPTNATHVGCSLM